MADLAETAEALQSVIEDVLTVGATIIAVGRLTYRGKGSGVETETPVEEALARLGPSSSA